MLHRRIADGGSITITAAALLLVVTALHAKLYAFQIPPSHRGRRRWQGSYKYQKSHQLLVLSSSSSTTTLSSVQKATYKRSVLLFAHDDAEAESREAEETNATPFIESDRLSDGTTTNGSDDPSKTIVSYKSGLSQSRTTSEPRPGSTRSRPIDVTMKFGGSSLANAECIDRVAKLIRDRIRPPHNEDGTPSDEVPVRPRAGE